MTENEALNALKLEGGLQIDGKAKRVAQFFEGLSVAEEALTEIQEYRAIGTVEELQALKEKNVAKKPNGISKEYGDYFGSCPICNRSAINYLNMPYKYCPKCGQKLDWE